MSRLFLSFANSSFSAAGCLGSSFLGAVGRFLSRVNNSLLVLVSVPSGLGSCTTGGRPLPQGDA